MKRIVVVGIAIVCALIVAHRAAEAPRPRSSDSGVPSPPPAAPAPAELIAPSPGLEYDNEAIARANAAHARDVPVIGRGFVTRLLPDDAQGDRHQRFLVRLPSGQSILIVHNLDIAPRVEGLRVGEPIEFEGEFVWNDKGGLVHWTHHDPAGRHKAGAIRYHGRTFR